MFCTNALKTKGHNYFSLSIYYNKIRNTYVRFLNQYTKSWATVESPTAPETLDTPPMGRCPGSSPRHMMGEVREHGVPESPNTTLRVAGMQCVCSSWKEKNRTR